MQTASDLLPDTSMPDPPAGAERNAYSVMLTHLTTGFVLHQL